MTATKLSGTGAVMMTTLEESLILLQRVHGLVEQMNLAQKNGKSTSIFGLQIRRVAEPMVGKLKGQFGMLADQVSSIILAGTRGGNEIAKIRGLQAQIGLLRTSIDMAKNKVKAQHSVAIEIAPD